MDGPADEVTCLFYGQLALAHEGPLDVRLDAARRARLPIVFAERVNQKIQFWARHQDRNVIEHGFRLAKKAE